MIQTEIKLTTKYTKWNSNFPHIKGNSRSCKVIYEEWLPNDFATTLFWISLYMRKIWFSFFFRKSVSIREAHQKRKLVWYLSGVCGRTGVPVVTQPLHNLHRPQSQTIQIFTRAKIHTFTSPIRIFGKTGLRLKLKTALYCLRVM